jgi:uncharacterized protein
VLDGARQILMERFAEDAELIGKLREYLADHGVVASTVIADKENDPAAAKFRDWFDFREAIETVPSHRALALFRGRNEGFLRLQLGSTPTPPTAAPRPQPLRGRIAGHFGIKDQGRRRRLAARNRALGLERQDLAAPRTRTPRPAAREGRGRSHPRLRAQPQGPAAGRPAGPRATLGLDPGLRTGVKVAVVDQTGKLVDTGVIYPEPRRDWDGSLHALARCARSTRSR